MINDFIKSELERYEEPERRGVPKGDPIGFGKKKIHAAILTGITNRDLKSDAEEVGISYTQIRVWRSQSDYKMKEREFQEKFINTFVQSFNYCMEKSSTRLVGILVDTIGSLNSKVIDGIFEKISKEQRSNFLWLINIAISKINISKITLKLEVAKLEQEIAARQKSAKKVAELLENPKANPAERQFVIDIFKYTAGE